MNGGIKHSRRGIWMFSQKALRSIDKTGVYCSTSRKMSCCQHTTAYVSPCKTNDTRGKNNPGHHCRWNASGVTPIKLYNIQVVGLK